MRPKLLIPILMLVAGCTTQGPLDPMVGSVAPDFKVESLSKPGLKVSLSQFAGKPVLLDFWATWCGPCKISNPEVAQVAQKHRNKGLVVLSITDEDRRTVEKSLKESPHPGEVYLDPFLSAKAPYGIASLPTFILIGADGKVAGIERGFAPGIVQAMVDKALAD